MPKIESGNTEYFLIDGVPYQRGAYELVKEGDDIGIARLGVPDKPSYHLISPVIFSDWTDSLDAPFASASAMITAVQGFIFK